MPNGDFRPFGAESRCPERCVVCKARQRRRENRWQSGQTGPLGAASGNSQLNNGERQFEQEMAGSAEAAVEPVSGEGGVKGGEWGEFTFFVFSRRTQRPERALSDVILRE